MGWSSGSRLFGEIVEGLMENEDEGFDYDRRRTLYGILIPIFEEVGDCDTLHEIYGESDEAFDEAFAEHEPEWVAEMLREQERADEENAKPFELDDE
jgi:hypothetical protein